MKPIVPPLAAGDRGTEVANLQAGLIVRESDGVFAAFSTRGQLNTGAYLFADARYSGMQPLLLQCDGRTIIPPPPHDATSPVDPGWVGFMPVLSIHDEAWAVRPQVKIVEGRRFQPGLRELVVGRGAARQFAGLVPGHEVKLGNQTWTRRRDGHQAAYEALPVGCANPLPSGSLPVPEHALEGSYRTASGGSATVASAVARARCGVSCVFELIRPARMASKT